MIGLSLLFVGAGFTAVVLAAGTLLLLARAGSPGGGDPVRYESNPALEGE